MGHADPTPVSASGPVVPVPAAGSLDGLAQADNDRVPREGPGRHVGGTARPALSWTIAAWALLAAVLPAAETVLTILHTADVHGHVEAVPPERGAKPAGGLLRGASVIRRLRQQAPDAILLDLGDLIQGSAESACSTGRVVAEAVRVLGYDALVVGNHEFDGGAAGLARFYERVNAPVLAANLFRAGPGPALPGLKPFLGLERSGVRVAIVGLTNPLIPLWSRPCLLDGCVTADSVSTLRRILPAVRAWRPDVLVLAAHQGWRGRRGDPANEIGVVARAFPEFDLILGAHTHQAVERRDLSGVLYSQAGCHGQWVGEVRLTLESDTRRVVRREARLHAVGSDEPPDPEMAARVAADLAAARRALKQPIGWAACSLSADPTAPGQSRAQTLLAMAIAEQTGAEVVFHGALSDAVVRAGRMVRRDVWRLVPYDNYLAVARLTLDEVDRLLEENSGYYGTRDFRGVYGLTYDLRPNAPAGRRVNGVRLTRADPAPGARVRVAFNSYDLASAGGRFPVLRALADQPAAHLEERLEYTTRGALLEFLRTHNPVDIEAVPGARVLRGPAPAAEREPERTGLKP